MNIYYITGLYIRSDRQTGLQNYPGIVAIISIDRKIYLETRTSLINKHPPNTEKSQRELETDRIVYLFNMVGR